MALDTWYEEVKIERNKFDILVKLVMKHKRWEILDEFWTYFEGKGWEQTKIWEDEEECPPYCSQGSLPIEEEPCEVCRRKEE